MEKISDERLDVLVQQRVSDEEWYTTELQTLYLLQELQEWRSGKRQRWQDKVGCTISANSSALDTALAQTAAKIGSLGEQIKVGGTDDDCTKPRKRAKWERRLEMMRGTLEKEEIGERRWQCSLCFEGHTFYGPTAKAAVKAAWRAYKEARDA